MLTRICFSVVLCAVGLLVGCQAGGREGVAQKGEIHADGPVAVLRVSGLSCPLCAHNIHQQMMAIPGVRGVRVDLGKGEVIVSLANKGAPDGKTLGSAIEQSGFGMLGVESIGAASSEICDKCACGTCSCTVALTRCGLDCSCRS
jgi:copper chaperone CopZ